MVMEKPTSVAAYFKKLPPEQREPLRKLRETIAAAAPEAEEGITYSMPGFLLDGKGFVAYAAFKDHCSLFPGTGRMAEELGDEITPYMSGKGTIRFTIDEPLPPELVEKVVKSRLADLAGDR